MGRPSAPKIFLAASMQTYETAPPVSIGSDCRQVGDTVKVIGSRQNSGQIVRSGTVRKGFGRRPMYCDIEGAPARIGDKVVVTGSRDETFNPLYKGRIGIVEYLEYQCGCGQTYPGDPMIGVRFRDGAVEEFWVEELNSLSARKKKRASRGSGSLKVRADHILHGPAMTHPPGTDMVVGMPAHRAQGYKNPTQCARVISEAWGEENLYCPNCDSPSLKRSKPNTPVIDFLCPQCASTFQLKCQSRPFSRKINDAG